MGSQLARRPRLGYPMVSNNGKTYTFTVRSWLQVLQRRAGHRRELREARSTATLNPTMQSPARRSSRHRGRAGVIDGKAQTASGVTVKGNKLIDQADEAGRRLPGQLGMPFFRALPTNLAINPQGVNTSRLRARTTSRAAPSAPDRAEEEPVLQGHASART